MHADIPLACDGNQVLCGHFDQSGGKQSCCLELSVVGVLQTTQSLSREDTDTFSVTVSRV